MRRKLFQNERDRLQERRKELNPDSEYDIYTNDLRTEAPEKKAGGDGIEGDQGVKSHQSYGGDGAIEKLKSLSKTYRQLCFLHPSHRNDSFSSGKTVREWEAEQWEIREDRERHLHNELQLEIRCMQWSAAQNEDGDWWEFHFVYQFCGIKI